MKITFLMNLSKSMPLFTTWIKRIRENQSPGSKISVRARRKNWLAISFPSSPTGLSHSHSVKLWATSSVIHFYLRPKHTEVVRSVRKQRIDSAPQSSLLQVPSTYNSAWPTYWRDRCAQCIGRNKRKLDKGIVSSTFLLEWPWTPSVQAPRVLSLRYHLTYLPHHQYPQILGWPMDLRYCLTFQFLLNPGRVSPLWLWLSTLTGPHSRYIIWIQPAISTTSYQRWKQPISRWPLWSWFPVLYFPLPIFLVWKMWLEQFCTCYFSVSYNLVC